MNVPLGCWSRQMASAYEATFRSMGRWSAVSCARQLGLVACECLDRAAFKLGIRRPAAYLQPVLTARLQGASRDQLPNSDFRNAIVKAVALSLPLAADRMAKLFFLQRAVIRR
jgi:hypothetical protein